MNKIIILITLSLSIIACSQNKKNTMKENPLLSTIKKYNDEPIYQITVETIYNYEILANDIPVMVKHNNFMTTFGTFNNAFILKSGLQNLEIRLYPIIPYVKEGDAAQPAKEFLQNDLNFNLIVEQTAWDKNGNLEEPKEVLSYNLPNEKEGKKIDFSKLKEYREKLNFNATVPYVLKGWEESEDLSKMDQKVLQEKVIAFFNKFRNSFENKDSDFYINSIKNAEFNYYQSNYYKINNAQSKSNKWIDFIKEGKQLEPIDKYDLKIYGNGKMVSLRGVDSWNKDEGVLRYKYTKGGFNYVLTFDIFLHIPKGSEEFEIGWFTMLDKNFLKGVAK